MKTIALIDGDLLAYQATASSEYEVEWCDDLFVLSSNLDEAKAKFGRYLAYTLKEVGTSDYVIVLSGSQNFRKTINPSYKSNRKGRKPLGYRKFIAWLSAEHPVKLHDQLEADDYLGILSTSPSKTRRVIVSTDKDMLTVPGWLFRDGKLVEITEAEADKQHLIQTLTGDQTDGYKGCPGYGPVTAQKLIDKDPTWEAVVAAYEKAGLSADDALMNARMARILRASDWDSKKKEVKLWNPPLS